MVKPITKEILFMNCLELDFSNKVELEHWIATFEKKVWTDDIMKKLSKAGLVRTSAAQVWNKEKHRITKIFEYENEKAYKNYQKIITKEIMPKAMAHYTPRMRNNRGIVFYDFRSWIKKHIGAFIAECETF